MTDLKSHLFPDTNITGKTDRNNQPILVGQRLRDENDEVWNVIMQDDGTYGVEHPEVQFSFIRLNDFIVMSQWVEIVPVPDALPVCPPEAEEAFKKFANLLRHAKPTYKTVSTSKTRRLP